MKAYRIATNAKIECLGDPVGEVLIMNIPLAEHQRVAAVEARCELVDVQDEKSIQSSEPYITFPDDLYLSWAMLKAFVDEVNKEPVRPAILGIRRTTGESENIAAMQDVTLTGTMVVYPVRYVVPNSNREPIPVLVETQDVMQIKRKWLDHVLPAAETIHYVTHKSIIQIITPVHLGIANAYAIMNWLAGVTRRGFLGKLARFLLKVARIIGKEKALMTWLEEKRKPSDKAPPRFTYWLMRCMNKIGKNCDIHPTAVIEGSVIGDNVRIGAFALVQFSSIGDNVDLSEFSNIRFSSIGHDTQVISRARISFCVVYPRVFYVAQGMQFAVVGRDAQLYSAIYSDFRLDGRPLKTPFRGKLVDSHMPFLGSTIGHRAKVAAGFVVAPGRVIPNGVTIYPNKSAVLDRVPDGLKEGSVYFTGE